MKKKAISVLLAAMIGTALLAGCGSSGGTGTSASTDSAEAKTTASASGSDTLQVDIWDNNQLAGLQQIADE